MICMSNGVSKNVNKYLLSTYSVPGILDTEVITIYKTIKNSCPHQAYSSRGIQMINKINYREE